MSVDFPIQWHSSQTPTSTRRDESQEKEKTVSFAKHTLIKVEEETRERLNLLMKKHGRVVLNRWLGEKSLKGFISGEKETISVKEARAINLNARTEVFSFNAKNGVVFAVDQLIRNRIRLLTGRCFNAVCNELKLPPNELTYLKNGIRKTISKQHADKFNDYFRKQALQSGAPCFDVFDLDRIFQLALNEPISKDDPISEKTYIKIEPADRSEIKSLPQETLITLTKTIGYQIFYHIRNDCKGISIKNAVLINEISGKTIFNFPMSSFLSSPIHSDHLVVLNELFKREEAPEKIIKKIDDFNGGRLNTVDFNTATLMNSYFNRNVFDIESILSQAVRGAKEGIRTQFLVSQTTSIPKKRSFSDVTASEDPAEVHKKRPRIKASAEWQSQDFTSSLPLYMDRSSLVELILSGSPPPSNRTLLCDSPSSWNDWTLFSFAEKGLSSQVTEIPPQT